MSTANAAEIEHPLETFVRNREIKLRSRWLGVEEQDGWEHNAWRVTLAGPRGRMTTTFRMGLGLTGAPVSADVLNSLALHASAAENARDFDDWCADFGFDTDSRKAWRTYRQCIQLARRLERFLGPTAYAELLEINAEHPL